MLFNFEFGYVEYAGFFLIGKKKQKKTTKVTSIDTLLHGKVNDSLVLFYVKN